MSLSVVVLSLSLLSVASGFSRFDLIQYAIENGEARAASPENRHVITRPCESEEDKCCLEQMIIHPSQINPLVLAPEAIDVKACRGGCTAKAHERCYVTKTEKTFFMYATVMKMTGVRILATQCTCV